MREQAGTSLRPRLIPQHSFKRCECFEEDIVMPDMRSRCRMKRILKILKTAAAGFSVAFLLALNALAQKPVLAPSPSDSIRSVAGTGTATFSGENNATPVAAGANAFVTRTP